MKEQIVRLERLWKKGMRIAIRIPAPDVWREMTKRDPTIPRSFTELRRLGKEVIGARHRPQFQPLAPGVLKRGYLARRWEECGESFYFRFFAGLGNPFLTNRQRQIIEADIDAETPTFENNIETDHFILRWTNASAHAPDNIADSAIVTETGEHLETAWERYNSIFGKPPYVPTGSAKIEVIFLDIAVYGVASPPDGPIQFDAANWVNQSGIRRPTSAHELFHKLQYAFGYRTLWTPTTPYKWFSEGSASWAEVFIWQRVSGSYKVTDLFSNPDLNLYDSSYSALPFWIFYQTRMEDAPGDIPLVSFLQKYEIGGDERNAMAEVIEEDWPPNNVYGQLDHFFALFSRERWIGAWRQTPTGGQPYEAILGPDGTEIIPALTTTDVPLGPGDSYTTPGSVSLLGADYYRFNLQPETDGRTLTLNVRGVPGGDYSYFLLWEKAGVWKRALFPFSVKGDYGFSGAIDMENEDAVVVIIGGRGVGGAYTLTTSVS